MAKQYVAMSQIRVGRAPAEDTVFEAGDVVTGLSKDEMIALWDAQVITEQVEQVKVADERDQKIADLEQELAELRAAQAAAAVPQGEAPVAEGTPEAPAEGTPEGTPEAPVEPAP
jgi:hypothetical protein